MLLNKLERYLSKSEAVRHYRKVGAYLFFGVVAGAVMTAHLVQFGSEQTIVDTSLLGTSVVDNSAVSATSSLPFQLRIPKVGIEAYFEEPLGVNENREIDVPESYETVGYYKYGPRPGEIGPAVVLGHVDSYQGPAVLYPLGQVEVGDVVEIEQANGNTLYFEVENIERHSQSGFPTTKVYGDLDYAGLRLITCSGVYDHGIQRYSHNLIVFAHLVEEVQVGE